MLPDHPEAVCQPVQTQVDIACVAQLARQIWTQHYTPIIGDAQVQYMLTHFQSETAIQQQIAAGHEYFILFAETPLTNAERIPVGYIDIVAEPDSGKLFLSKLYIIEEARGYGFGRAMFDHALSIAMQRGLNALWLTVNKLNPALHTYLQWGMVNQGSVVKDIGGGFVMDDFQLETAL